jgi:hypothetical protein
MTLPISAPRPTLGSGFMPGRYANGTEATRRPPSEPPPKAPPRDKEQPNGI